MNTRDELQAMDDAIRFLTSKKSELCLGAAEPWRLVEHAIAHLNNYYSKLFHFHYTDTPAAASHASESGLEAQ